MDWERVRETTKLQCFTQKLSHKTMPLIGRRLLPAQFHLVQSALILRLFYVHLVQFYVVSLILRLSLLFLLPSVLVNLSQQPRRPRLESEHANLCFHLRLSDAMGIP